jgi:hypothetical protein
MSGNKYLSSTSGRLWIDSEAPGISEINCEIGSFWFNSDKSEFYICKDATFGAQAWKKL